MCSKYNNMQLSTVNLFLQEIGVGMKITNGKIKYKKWPVKKTEMMTSL